MSLGPQSRDEEVIYAEENLRVDLQLRLQKLLNHTKLSRREFAVRAGMTEQQVSRLFSSSANPRLRTLARLFHALGDECVITSSKLETLAGRSNAFNLAAWSQTETRIASPYQQNFDGEPATARLVEKSAA